MKTYACGYNFPLIGIAGKSETVVKTNVSSSLELVLTLY